MLIFVLVLGDIIYTWLVIFKIDKIIFVEIVPKGIWS